MKTIKITTIVCLMQIFAITTWAQNWQWTRQNGSDKGDGGGCLFVDNNGNTYFGGYFDGTQCFFTNDTSNYTQGDGDFYLIKYDANGNEIWWQQFGANNPVSCGEGVGGMTVDTNGNIFIVGVFCGTVTFGSVTLNGFGSEFYLANYNSSGTCLWAKAAGGFGKDGGSGVALDSLGNIYVCGSSTDSATFDTIKIGPGGFIVKYDANGNCLWAKNKFRHMGWWGPEVYPSDINIYGSDILINAEIINDTIIVDTITIINPPGFVVSDGLFSFDYNGNVKWIRQGGGPNAQSVGNDFAVDASGNSYFTGTFTAYGIFGNDTLHNGTQKDAFLAKYDINGNMQWVQQLYASGGSYGFNVSSDGDGTTYFTGKFSGSALFGSYNVTAGNANGDMFIARYNTSGTCLGVRNFGEACGYGITQDVNGNPFVCGTFNNTVSIGATTFTSHGMEDIFIAKLDVFTGIGEEERTSNNQLLIYANPNQGKCNITVPDDFLNEKNLTLSIYDNTGKLIQQKTLQMNDGKIKLNLDAEAKGIYNVLLSNGKKNYSGRIVFE